MEKQSISNRSLTYCNLGVMDYQSAWDLQHELYGLRLNNKIGDMLLLLEHPNTYTLGKAADKSNVIASPEFIERNGISLFEIDRGGDVTYHGPGQIVGYIIMDLRNWKKDSHLFLRSIESAIMNVCSDYGVSTEREPKYTGVWVNDGKICAIGVKISRWITMHGFAFNVNTNLEIFNGIIPCGIRDKKVTSLEKELHKKINLEEVKEKIVNQFSKEFKYQNFSLQDKEKILEFVEREKELIK